MTADPLDPATTTTDLYFTRWITHFWAPVFVFLSRLSAIFLSAINQKMKQVAFFLKEVYGFTSMKCGVVSGGCNMFDKFLF